MLSKEGRTIRVGKRIKGENGGVSLEFFRFEGNQEEQRTKIGIFCMTAEEWGKATLICRGGKKDFGKKG